MTAVYLIAIAFGAIISLGLYFIFFWPSREPQDDGDDGGDGGDRGE